MMFRTSRDPIDEGFLDGGIEVAIDSHEILPPSLNDRGIDLTNAGCEGNWTEICGVFGIGFSCLLTKKA